jgi:uncharacterized protein (TIGR02246 family)
MRHRFALSFLLALAIAPPAVAQNAASPEAGLHAQIEAVFNAWLDALNRHDGRAAAAFFLPGAPAINPGGMVPGDSPDYVNRVEQQNQQGMTQEAQVDRVEPIGDAAAYAVGTYIATLSPGGDRQQRQGHWLQLFERRGASWKIAASSFTQVGPPRPLGNRRNWAAPRLTSAFDLLRTLR